MELLRFTLPNGIRLVHQPVAGAVSHCGIFIRAGSRNETAGEHGLAHFIEHVIFKGTRKRNLFQVLNRLENVGADLNAFTTKEETCIYASFLSNYYERTLELISDICNNSIFPERELEKEKVVVTDEIRSYQDTPSEQIFDDFEDMVFEGHPLGRNILGTPSKVKKFKPDSIYAFLQRNYLPENIVIASVGDIAEKKLIRLVTTYFSGWKFNGEAIPAMPFDAYIPRHKEIRKRIFQTHCITGATAYPVSSGKRYTLAFLNNILGGPAMNSRLSLSLREKNGIAYHIESGYHAFSDSGIVTIYFGTDKRNFERANELVRKETDLLRTKRLTGLQIHHAKQQLIGQLSIAQESNANRMLAIGKNVLFLNRHLPIEMLVKEIGGITPDMVLEVANEIFEPERMSSLVFHQSS